MSRQKCSAVLVTVLILAAVTLLAADCPPQYVDMFDDPTSGWRRVDEPMGGADYVDGEYAVWSNLAKWIQEEWSPVAITCEQAYTVEATAYSLRELMGVWYGVLVGSDSDNAYWFCIAPEGLFRVARSHDGTFESVVPWTKCDAINPALSKNEISVAVGAATASLTVNGVAVRSLALAGARPTRAGVFVGGATEKDQAAARFTQFSVRGPTAQELGQATGAEASLAVQYELPFVDDFTDPLSGWSSAAYSDAVRQYVDGGYSITLKKDKFSMLSWAPLSDTCPAAFSLTATAHAPALSSDVVWALLVGRGPDDCYWFQVSADGFYRVSYKLKGVWQSNLVEWTNSDLIWQGPQENTLQVIVAEGGALLVANGTPLKYVELSEQGPYRVGVVAASSNVVPAEVIFTSFAVREAGAQDIATLQTAKGTSGEALALNEIPFADTFDNPSTGWRVGDDEYGERQYVDGLYSILTKKTDRYNLSWAPLSGYCPEQFSMEAACRFSAEARDASCSLIWGLGASDFYRFSISADGFYSVDHKLKGVWQTDLVEWTKSDLIGQGASENRLRVVISGSDAMVEVNGRPLVVVELTMPGPYKVGVSAQANTAAPAEVRFDSFGVREATGGDIAVLHAARTTVTGTAVAHEIPFADSFDDPSTGWPEYAKEGGDVRQYIDGTYSVMLKETDKYWISWAPLAGYCPESVSVETSVRFAPGVRDAVCGVAWGLGDDDFYRFSISADGFYSIDHKRKGVWQTDLVEWTQSDLVNQGAAENRLRVVVAGGKAMVEVNGTPVSVVELTMPGPYKVGVFGATGEAAPAELRFTSFAVREAAKDDTALLGSVKNASAATHVLPFVEEFDFPSSGWGSGGKSGKDAYGYRSGEFFFEQREKNRFRWIWAPLTGGCPENYVVELIGYARTGDDADWGIVCGLDGDNFYWFRVFTNGRFDVQLMQRGEWQTAPVEARASQAVETGWRVNSLRLIVVGREAALQINGQTVTLVNLKFDGQYRVGIAAGSRESVPAEIRFTEFSVREAQPNELPSQTTSAPTTTPSGGTRGDRDREP